MLFDQWKWLEFLIIMIKCNESEFCDEAIATNSKFIATRQVKWMNEAGWG